MPPDSPDDSSSQSSESRTASRTVRAAVERGKGFLEERPGHKSAMRAMSFVALVTAMVFGWVALHKEPLQMNDLYLTFGFLVAAFAPKAVQKYAEGAIPVR